MPAVPYSAPRHNNLTSPISNPTSKKDFASKTPILWIIKVLAAQRSKKLLDRAIKKSHSDCQLDESKEL
jgi:hypothetical protein